MRLLAVLLLLAPLAACPGKKNVEPDYGTADLRADWPQWRFDGRAGDRSAIEAGIPAPKTCKGRCMSNTDCDATRKGGCDLATGECLQCSDSSHCDTSLYKGGCDLTTHTCRTCNVDDDCGALGYSFNKCDTATGRCKACESNTDCVMTSKCDTKSWTCSGCESDTDCLWSMVTPYCGANKVCVACTKDSDCAGGILHTTGCDPATGQCTQCRSDDECCFQAGCGMTCDAATRTCTCPGNQICQNEYGPGNTLTWECR